MVKKLILISLFIHTFIISSGCAEKRGQTTFPSLKSSLSPFHLFSAYQSRKILKNVETHVNKRQYEKAETTLLKALKYNPKNTEAWIALGEIYFTIENYDSARHAYEEALRYDKDAFGAYAGLWKVRLEESGYTEDTKRDVKREIEEFISSKDKRPERLMAAYRGLRYLHEYDEAFKIVEEIVVSEPAEETISNLANYTFEESLRDKDLEKRLRQIEDFLRLFPSAKERYMVYAMRLSIAAKDLKDKELLYKYGEEWLSDEPDSRRANFSVGQRYIGEGVALEEAISYIKKALRLIEYPDPADRPEHYPNSEWHKDLQSTKGIYYDTLGQAYYKLGRYKEAEEAYRKATVYLAFNEDLYYHAGQMLEEKGDVEGAINSYVQALKSGDNKDAEERLNKIGRALYPPPLMEGGEGEGENAEGEKGEGEQRTFPDEPLYKFFAKKEGVTTFTDVTEEAGLSGVKATKLAWGDYNDDGYEDILFNGAILFKNNINGTFTKVTKEAGITEIPGANGGVWGDFNNDGYLDFYTFASGKGVTDRFWRNNGDGTFTDITETAVEEPDAYRTEAAAWGDYDSDGFLDLYIANYEKPLAETVERARCMPDRLFHNNGDGTFTDVTEGTIAVSLEHMCGRGVNWGDFDNDGDLDIYVANYRLDPNFLWQNNSDGTFTNVAAEVGVEGSEEEGAYGHSIGAEWGDYDNDGDLDLFVSNLAHPRYIGFSDKSMLLKNQGLESPLPSGERERVRGGIDVFRFVNSFGDSGIRFEETSADPSFADYDNDGILDLYFTSTYSGRKSFLYKGNGDGTFIDVTWLAGVRVDNGWGNAFADYDNDGDLDLLVASRDGVRLFRNDGNGNHWLHVQVMGKVGLENPAFLPSNAYLQNANLRDTSAPLLAKGSNQAGIGARVTVIPLKPDEVANSHIIDQASSLTKDKQIREVQGGKGSGSQHSLPVEFGLGNYSGPVKVEVRFPSGKIVRIEGVKPDQRIVVEED